MKRVFMIIIVLIVTVLTACNQEKTIKIGYTGCITGTNSDLGVSGMYGAMLAVNEINNRGGIQNKKIELIVKDDKGIPEIGLAVDKELVKENCIAIVGHMTSDMAELSIPYINKQKIPMISPTIALATLNDKDDYFIRLIPSTEEQANQFSLEIQKVGIKQVLVVSSLQNQIFAKSIYSYLSSELNNRKVLTEYYGPVDFTSTEQVTATIDKIVQSNAQAIVIIASADAVAQISQSMYLINQTKTVFLPAWSMTNDLIQRGGVSVNGYYGVSFINYQEYSAKYRKFNEEYIKTYGSNPTFASVMSYEALMLLYEGLKENPNIKSEELKNKILNQKVFQGLQGDVLINEFGDASRNLYLYQIRNGAFVKVDRND